MIIERIRQETAAGFVDWITLSLSLLFSMQYALSFEAFAKQTIYNNVKQTCYCADGYLDGLTVVKFDYYDLFRHYRDCPRRAVRH